MIFLKKYRKIGFYLGLFVIAVSLYFLMVNYQKRKLIIAPMIGGLEYCIFNKQDLLKNALDFQYTKLCAMQRDSPSALIESTLSSISKSKGVFSDYQLGYTLHVPLLKFFKIKGADFEIDKDAIRRAVSSIRDVDRPMVLYLFSNHFGSDLPIEDALALNPKNLLVSQAGILKKDKYYNVNIYPWSFASTNNQITHLREVAINAVFDELCKLPESAVKRVAGVTLLGELHHMFPDFQAGMGFNGDYLISDYSEESATDFKQYLKNRYKNINNLNDYLGSIYSNFDQINSPSKNIRKQKLNSYEEHIDAFAHGLLPISGWVAGGVKKPLKNPWIRIYKNGEFLTRVPVAFGRQDVLLAHPELLSSDVGWNYNFDYSNLNSGLYKVDVFLESSGNLLTHLATRDIAVMGKNQLTPVAGYQKVLPESMGDTKDILFSVDYPGNLSSYYYNPLVVLWHQFREEQIKRYLSYFEKIVKNKCVNNNLIYSHQILPFVNPGWDVTKFAVGNDLAVPSSMRLGVSLYGEASYGTSFFDWFKTEKRAAYGVTEFHPLTAMPPDQLRTVLDRHYKNNAQFISFFTEATGLEEDVTSKPNIFSFSPLNKNAGSDVLFHSMQEILK